jgi:maltose O-acetyltransferase
MSRWLLRLAEYVGQASWKAESKLHIPSALRSWRTGYWRAKLGAFGEGSHIHAQVIIHSPDKVRIGKNVNIVEFVHMWGGGGIEIGDNVIVASHTVITSETHNKYARLFRESTQCSPVSIGDNCWIGAGAIILPGVHIGQGCVIGAQAVVTRDIPPHSIVVGVPAHVIEELR